MLGIYIFAFNILFCFFDHKMLRLILMRYLQSLYVTGSRQELVSRPHVRQSHLHGIPSLEKEPCSLDLGKYRVLRIRCICLMIKIEIAINGAAYPVALAHD